MTHFSSIKSKSHLLSCLFLIVPVNLAAQEVEVIAPPSLGQQTQGEPANVSDVTANSLEADQATTESANETPSKLLGTTRIVERRGENGQIYRVELEHSNGSKQYIDRDYSDGEIDPKANNIEETPNLAKWRLGSW